MVTEFAAYIWANGAWIPNYGERYRARGDLQRVRRVDRQPGGQQADGQEAADALGAQKRSPASPSQDQGAQQRARNRLQALVPKLRHASRVNTGANGVGRLTSPSPVH